MPRVDSIYQKALLSKKNVQKLTIGSRMSSQSKQIMHVSNSKTAKYDFYRPSTPVPDATRKTYNLNKFHFKQNLPTQLEEEWVFFTMEWSNA